MKNESLRLIGKMLLQTIRTNGRKSKVFYDPVWTAAQAVKTGKTPATIDVQMLRDELRRQGAYLGE